MLLMVLNENDDRPELGGPGGRDPGSSTRFTLENVDEQLSMK